MLTSYCYLWFAVFGVDHEWSFHYYFHFTDLFFLMSMFIKFVTDYIPDGETEPEKDIKIISKRYLHDDFLIDFITLLPLSVLFEIKIFYVLKTLRMVNGVKMFNVGIILNNIKDRSKKNREKQIKINPTFAEDQMNNNNDIE